MNTDLTDFRLLSVFIRENPHPKEGSGKLVLVYGFSGVEHQRGLVGHILGRKEGIVRVTLDDGSRFEVRHLS